jgi:DnaJ-class molecular chaperone
MRGGGRGDQLVRVVLVTPEKLSPEERRLLERLAELQGDDLGRRGFWDRRRAT